MIGAGDPGRLGPPWELSAARAVLLTRRGSDRELTLTFDRAVRRRAPRCFWVVAALLWPASALGQGADELASMIEQSLAGIEFRLDLRPYQASQDLEAEGRRLELLEKEAPSHPALPALKRKYALLQAGIAAVANDAAHGVGAAAVPAPPAGFTKGLEQVDALQKQAESALLLDQTAEAESYLARAERQMASLEQRYRSAIPEGHAPLIVAEEKLAALKEQIAAAKASR
jgi:hypothetical protein